MDKIDESIILIGTSMLLFISLLLAILLIMLIFRKRKTQHQEEITFISEKHEKELLKTKFEVQQQTMKHIGREIHDNVGHQLTLAFLNLQNVSKGDKVEEVAKIIDSSISDLRQLTNQLLKESALEQRDFNSILSEECEKLDSLNLCQIITKLPKKPFTFSEEMSTFLIRIFQEFTQNSLKHAKCSHLTIELSEFPNECILMVKDDGVGFKEESIQKGFGLENMKRRAQIIQADLLLQSEVGAGTQMILKIPLYE